MMGGILRNHWIAGRNGARNVTSYTLRSAAREADWQSPWRDCILHQAIWLPDFRRE